MKAWTLETSTQTKHNLGDIHTVSKNAAKPHSKLGRKRGAAIPGQVYYSPDHLAHRRRRWTGSGRN